MFCFKCQVEIDSLYKHILCYDCGEICCYTCGLDGLKNCCQKDKKLDKVNKISKLILNYPYHKHKAIFYYKLGLEYAHKKDPENTFKWELKAAELGVAVAQYYIGMVYLQGRFPLEKADYKKAKFWLELSLENKYPKSAYSLGLIYEKGLGMLFKNQYKASTMYTYGTVLGNKECKRKYLERFPIAKGFNKN